MHQLGKLVDRLSEDDWVSLSEARWHEGRLALVFSVASGQGGDVRSAWTVSCEDVLEFSISEADGGGVNFYVEGHPAIGRYSEPVGHVNLNLPVESPFEAVGVLAVAHEEASNGWIEPSEIFGSWIELVENLESGNDRVASGPKSLIDAYVRALDEIGVRTNVVYQSVVPSSAPCLLHFGSSFVAAGTFDVVESKPGG